MKLFSDLVSSYNPDFPNFRPTEIYNESWLVKIAMSLASSIPPDEFPLSFLPSSSWFSEAQLPTIFKSRYRGDPLGESRTHADGVIGHFSIGNKAKVDFELVEKTKQFTVLEAKIGSSLSDGTTSFPDFDQAARNVACMAECLAQADLTPTFLDRLDFIVLAPEKSIAKGTFAEKMTKDSIKGKTEERAAAYLGEKEDKEEWYQNRFLPTWKNIQLHTLSWEGTIDWLCAHKPELRDQLVEFYTKCLKYN